MQTTITEFLDNEYIEYPFYVLENRAIPSMIDGFKTTQRKITETMRRVWPSNKGKAMKVVSLTGELMSKLAYHHSDASASGAIINMTQDFKNGLPLFKGIGQFGSLRNPEPGAPRYISVKPSKWFNILYKDNNLTKPQIDDGQKVEPEFFLPIIPMILVNGGSGIAVGYASNILNRNPYEITKACLEYLEKGQIKQSLLPWWEHYNGEIIINKNKNKNNSYYLKGSWEIVNSTTVQITELPPNMTFEKIEKLFGKLEDNKEIVSFEDNSSDKIDIFIKFKRADLKELNDDNIEKMFHLKEKYSENITCLNEKGKIEEFIDVTNLIQRFVNFRLTFYDKRKELLIKNLNDRINKLEEKIKFIQLVIDGDITINKRKRSVIENELKSKNFKEISTLLSVPIYSFTKDELDNSQKQLKELIKELTIIKKTTPKSMYVDDLKLLLKELKNYKK